jgi:hypothetical protein
VREGERVAGSRGRRSSRTCATPQRREVRWFKRRERRAYRAGGEREGAHTGETGGVGGGGRRRPGVELPRARRLGPRARRRRPRV